MENTEKIREYLGEFKSSYVIIGGTATNLNLELHGERGRSTKDIDMIVVCEAVSREYLQSFWKFIKAGGYQTWQVKNEEGGQRCFYRFVNPADLAFPAYIELFSRNPGVVELPEDAHLVHISNEEYLSSFSAILMDDEYYDYAVSHAIEINGVMSLDVPALIVLKAKAYLNNRQRKLEGSEVQNDDIVKHKKDVYRLSMVLPEDDVYEVCYSIKNDLNRFCELVLEEPINGKAISKYMGLPEKSMEELVRQLEQHFQTTV